MKEFIRKWSNWWIISPNRKQLDDAFEKELNELMLIKVLEELNLKLIEMCCFAEQYYNENDFRVTRMNIHEIRTWLKQKHSQHCG